MQFHCFCLNAVQQHFPLGPFCFQSGVFPVHSLCFYQRDPSKNITLLITVSAYSPSVTTFSFGTVTKLLHPLSPAYFSNLSSPTHPSLSRIWTTCSTRMHNIISYIQSFALQLFKRTIAPCLLSNLFPLIKSDRWLSPFLYLLQNSALVPPFKNCCHFTYHTVLLWIIDLWVCHPQWRTHTKSP